MGPETSGASHTSHAGRNPEASLRGAPPHTRVQGPRPLPPVAVGPQAGRFLLLDPPFPTGKRGGGEGGEGRWFLTLLLPCEFVPHPADLPSRLLGGSRKQQVLTPLSIEATGKCSSISNALRLCSLPVEKSWRSTSGKSGKVLLCGPQPAQSAQRLICKFHQPPGPQVGIT